MQRRSVHLFVICCSSSLSATKAHKAVFPKLLYGPFELTILDIAKTGSKN
jgi:hypothetical protein